MPREPGSIRRHEGPSPAVGLQSLYYIISSKGRHRFMVYFVNSFFLVDPGARTGIDSRAHTKNNTSIEVGELQDHSFSHLVF